MTALRAVADLGENRMIVRFPYSAEAVEAIRNVPGRRWVAASRFWTVPLDLTSGQRLREEFGEGLTLTDALIAWGREEVRRQRNLGSLVTADDATLDNVGSEAAGWLRPYQRADVKMMSMASVINANQPGVGKTVEVIYAVQEALLTGLHVVIAPITLHKDPWAEELAQHAPDSLVFWGSTPPARKQAMNDAIDAAERGCDVWLIVNPDMIRVQRAAADETRPILSRDHKGQGYVAKDDVARLFQVRLASLTVDEFHKGGLGENRNTLFARALKTLGENAMRRFPLSGTPMGGKPIRLWGALNFIEPELYGSKWRWAEQWLTNAAGDGPVDPGAGTGIGGIIPGREDAFYAAHAKHMVRRTRKDALPGLPDKVIINVDTPMTAKQRKEYDAFVAAAEVAVEGGRVAATGVLAEFTRAKQLANARCEVRDGEVWPTTDSGKLPALLERLDGFGVRTDNPEPRVRAIVASESKRMVQTTARYLAAELPGIEVRELTGEVTGAARDEVIDWYKSEAPAPRVLVMTTQTGGVGLNLGMTGSIHILDETWNPDDQEQLEDRGMRNRTTPLMVLYYRTEDSIQQYIAEVAGEKRVTNRNILEVARYASKRRRGE